MRRQQAAWDASANHVVFYMYVFSGAYHAGWHHISKYKTEENRRRRAELVHSRLFFFPRYWQIGLTFGDSCGLQNHCVWQVTNPVTLPFRWELSSEPLRKLESSEAPLPLLQGRRDVPIPLFLSFAGKLLLQAALAVIAVTVWSSCIVASYCWIFVEFYWWTEPYILNCRLQNTISYP